MRILKSSLILLRGAGKLFRHLETGKNVHHGILAGVDVPGGHGNRRMPRDPRQRPSVAPSLTQPREEGNRLKIRLY
jgi:hypothetical protein